MGNIMNRFRPWFLPLLTILFGSIAIIACGQQSQITLPPTVVTATLPATLEVSATTTPSPAPRPTETTQPTPTSTPDLPTPSATSKPLSLPYTERNLPLDPNGPWLVYVKNRSAVMVVNADGTGLQQVPIRAWGVVGSIVNGLVAGSAEISTTTPARSVFLLSMPDLALKLIPLVTYPDIPDDEDYQKLLDEAFSAGGPVWSPDGRLLAFAAAIDGPSADLYVYNPSSNTLRRLTDGVNQAADPEWSPDSRWIVHREVNGWGAGCHDSGLWAAAADGSGVKWLFEGECVIILGWVDSDTFVSYQQTGAISKLRITDLKSGESTWLFEHELSDRPFFNPWTREILFSPVDPVTWLMMGTYIARPPLYQPAPFSSEKISAGFDPVWLRGMGLITTGYRSQTCDVVAVTTEGKTTCLEDFGNPLTSPDHEYITTRNKNDLLRLHKSDGELIREIAQNSRLLSWQPDSKGLVYQTSGGKGSAQDSLYYIALPDGEPQKLITINSGAVSDYHFIWRPDSMGLFIFHTEKELFYYDISKNQLLLVDEEVGPYYLAYTWAQK